MCYCQAADGWEARLHHLDFKLLRSFAAVAGEQSVTRAAERLNLTQPTVSGQIKEMEQTLGFLLFHRTSRKVALSEQGERLLPLVEALLIKADEVRLAAEAMQVAAATHFKLGAAMYTMDLADRALLLEDFAASGAKLHYSIINRLQFDQVRHLLTDRLDAALLLGIAADMPESRFTSDLPSGVIANEVQYPRSLERVVLSSRKVGLLVPDDLPLARHQVIPRGALAGQSVAMLGKEHGEALDRSAGRFPVGARRSFADRSGRRQRAGDPALCFASSYLRDRHRLVPGARWHGLARGRGHGRDDGFRAGSGPRREQGGAQILRICQGQASRPRTFIGGSDGFRLKANWTLSWSFRTASGRLEDPCLPEERTP